MPEIKFSLTDAWGKEHAYKVDEFSVDETGDLHADVAGLLAGPLAEVIGAVAKVQLAAGLKEKLTGAAAEPGATTFIGIGAIVDTLRTLDWSQLGEALQLLPKLIKEASDGGKPHKLYARILAKTERERFEPTDNGGDVSIMSPVSTPAERDRAYGGGNIMEQYKAVLSVLAVHFGPFGRSGSNVWSELSSTLLGALPMQRSQSSETPAPNGAGGNASAPPPS